jgi:rare lipoprotein A
MRIRTFPKFVTASLLFGVIFLQVPERLIAESVTCSYYSPGYDGRRTASGHIFSNSELTAASKTLPFGTKVKLTNPKNGHSVVVRVNDRGPFVQGRDISVTRAAAQRLHMLRTGVAQLEMENLSGEAGTAKGKK